MALSVKDIIIAKISSEDSFNNRFVVQRVIDHQFTEANEALNHNHEVEISGFGKFIFKEQRAVKLLPNLQRTVVEYNKKLKDPNLDHKEKINLNKRIVTINGVIKYLINKLENK